MKFSIKPEHLKTGILGAGGLGLALRILLYATGTDDKGLLATGHWASIALWCLTAAVLAALALFTRQIQGPEDYRDCYPASSPAGIAGVLLALAIGLTTFTELGTTEGPLGIVSTVLGFAAAVCLLLLAYCRMAGAKPLFLFHAVVCVYFALRMVCQYRHWSSDPQLQDYCFYLCAYVALMLTAYHHAAFDADMGKHRVLWFLSLAAVYLCCLSLKGTQDTLLLLAAGFWAFTNMTCLNAKPRRKRPAMVFDEE